MNDKNDILQMLRDREEEFHLPLRKDGWEKLEAELPLLLPEEEQPPVAMEPVHRKLYRWGTVAAVALICLMVSVVVLRREGPQETVVAERTVVTPPQTEKPVAPVLPEEQISGKSSVARFFPYLPVADSLLPELSPVELPHREAVAEGIGADSVRQSAPSKSVRKDSGPQPDKRRRPSPYHPVEEKKRIFDLNRFAFGIQTGSNNVTNMEGGLEHFEFEVSDPGPPPNPDDKPEPPIKDPVEEIETKASSGGGSGSGSSGTSYYYRHRLPVTVGLSARTFITSRLALETGLSYTYLYSEIVEEKIKQVGSQRLHYLGIPLKLSWTFYKQKNLSFYASGGGMIEYCISAKKTDDHLHINRWQPSWNAAAGMQVELRKPLSLFVEPGVSYYYNLNPQLRGSVDRFESIRTARPFTFTFQFGIRFTY